MPPLENRPFKTAFSCFIGFDPREAAAFAVARETLKRNIPSHWPVYGLVLDNLIAAGLYTRPTTTRINSDGHVEMIDVLSIRPDYDGRISTQHANARFLTPHLAKHGWALFMDGDMLIKGNVGLMMQNLDPKFAVYCVKRHFEPEPGTKMDGQEQTKYPRKQWSSFVVFNCDHPANQINWLGVANTMPGADLHRFFWLSDDEIGELDSSWNVLLGHDDPEKPADVLHWTNGLPDMPGYENAPHADLWRKARNDWAQGALSLPA